MTKHRLHNKLGIRIQLAILYSTVFAILLLLAGIILVVNVHQTLLDSIDTNLQLRSIQIANDISLQGNTIILHDDTGTLSGLINNDEITGLIRDNKSTEIENFNYKDPATDTDLDAIVRIIGPGKETAYVTPAFKRLNLPTTSTTDTLHGNTWLGTVTAQNGQKARVYSMPLQHNGKIFGLLQVGTPLSSLSTTINSIIVELIFIAPLVLLLGAMGSYWLATRAFQPIQRLIYTARTIKAGDLHQRVPVAETHDEIQYLALTFNEMLDSLERQMERQRRFTADVSHELRTPIAAIRSMTDVALAQELQQDEHTTVLRHVNGQAERLGRLISDLLTLVHADEGHIPFEREPIYLDQLASGVVETMLPLAQERGIRLYVQAHTPALIIGDEARLMQLMLNLIDNALNYTSTGGKVMVSVIHKSTNVYLQVSDTGIGIAPEHIEHIFERFYRTDNARSRATGGSGLGLAIVKWVVREHHGTIRVDSQPGRGTTFTVTLPAATKQE
jgi:two-component system OmpR family sensor kinase